MVRIVGVALAAGLGLAALPALAEGGGGGGTGSPNRDASVAGCAQKGADGKPVRKLSSEEVCPMYQFWRDDCSRDGQLGLVNAGTREHCSVGALGIGRDEDVVTGSLKPVGR